jgi:alpha-ketoglutarate-dependent taurine dioxygenase
VNVLTNKELLMPQKQAVDKKQTKRDGSVGLKTKMKSLKGRTRRAAVAQEELQQLSFTPLSSEDNGPLLARSPGNNVDLFDWLSHNEGQWRELLYRHGAVVFRGFGIDTVERMERFSALTLKDIYRDNTEHRPASDGSTVQVPVEYASDQKLLWHNENTFNLSWPQRAIFACAIPAATGGETPLVDSRLIYQHLPAEIKQPFIDKGVMYVRKYGPDGAIGLSWQKVFNSQDRSVVEQVCRDNDFDFEWRDDGHLITRGIRPAVLQHPVSGDWSWFNQAQHWHFSCLNPATQKSLSQLFSEADYPRNAYYGDGSRIPDAVMKQILTLYQRYEVAFPWQRGDVALVDNILSAHGRNPFTGERRLMVNFGDMASF